jgi:hypothetical protein
VTISMPSRESGLQVSDDVLSTFEERMIQIWQRGNVELVDPHGTARLIRLLIAQEGMAAAGEVLASTDVRAGWNRVFAEERSEFLAGWVAPYLQAPVLDVLGGDFTVLQALLRHGLDPIGVAGCERSHAYDVDWSVFPFPVHDVPDDPRLPGGDFRTAFICTVLHHERDVDRLLAAIAATPARRWVVVENCLDAENSEEFHLFTDEFFNRCLNTFDVPCVPQHRTAQQWRDLLGAYGTITAELSRGDVPGMPFPYTMFVVDRRQ